MSDKVDVRLAGRYRLESEVGAGGMTTVWQAVDEVLERRVAVKILHHHLLSNEIFCDRFRKEALAAGALTHPAIAAVYDTGLYDDAPYVVSEYLGGGSLERALAQQGPLPPARVAEIGAAVCEALAFAHRAGVLHGDLKPSNIVFSDPGPLLGQVKVVDFGVAAAALGGDLTATGALLGTLSFLAPEILAGGEPGPAGDLYALGVVLFKALTGRSPRSAGSDLAGVNRSRSQPAHPRDFRPDVPRDLDTMVAKALADAPEERFSEAAEFGRLLRSAAEPRGPRGAFGVLGVLAPDSSPPPPPPPPPAPPEGPTSFVRSEGRWLVPVILLVAVGIGIVLGVLQLSGKLSGLTSGLTGGGGSTPAAGSGLQQVTLSAGGTLNPPPEHPEDVAKAFDGNPSTFWETQVYQNYPKFGNVRSGVGIYGKLAAPTALKQIEVDSPTPGWSGGIEYSSDGTTWSAPISVVASAAGTQDFTIPASVGPQQYWMVWITSLPGVPGQPGSYQAEISEVKAFH